MKRLSVVVLSLLCIFCVTGNAVAMEKIRIATEGAYPPFNMKTSNGELTGFDVEIARALCEHMKIDFEIVAQDWDGIIPGLLAKKYDAIVASMSITDERKKKVAFTNPYYSNYLRFMAPKDTDLIVTSAGLKGKELGAQRATIAAQALEDRYRKIAKIKVYDTQEAAYLDMKARRVQALLTDIYPGYDWLRQPENKDFKFIGDPIDINDKIAIAVRKGNQALVDRLNAAIEAIRADGTYARINAKYFPFDIY